jgi:hypothetical protein
LDGISSDHIGIGEANGVTAAQAANFKSQLADATLENAIAPFCYWSLCGATLQQYIFWRDGSHLAEVKLRMSSKTWSTRNIKYCVALLKP